MVTRLRHLRTLNLRNNDIEGRIDDVLWGVELGPEVVQRDDGEEEETEEEDDDDDNDDDDPAVTVHLSDKYTYPTSGR